jgi:isopentenyl phosphate kinase
VIFFAKYFEHATTISLAQLKSKVVDQKVLIPSLHGDVDFSITPERFTVNSGDERAVRKTRSTSAPRF